MAVNGFTEDVASLAKTVAVRLCAARRVSGLKQHQVAERVGQKNMTQVSLWESGDRLPKLTDVILMARTYGVPMDFLCGLSDDPLADQQENNQGFLTNMISSAIQKNHLSWVQSTAQSVAVAINAHSQDRQDLQKLGPMLRDARKAYARIKQLNPDYDDEIRGASTFEAALARLEDVVTESTARIDEQFRQCDIIEREMEIAGGEFQRRSERDTNVSVSQMMLDIISE
jgi:transcriptional regulator with XRE-family HTH domain